MTWACLNPSVNNFHLPSCPCESDPQLKTWPHSLIARVWQAPHDALVIKYCDKLSTFSVKRRRKKEYKDIMRGKRLFIFTVHLIYRLCGLMVRVFGYKSRGLERGPLSLASTIEELFERKRSGSGLENRDYGRRGSDALTMRHPLYSQKLALTSPTSGGHSVSIVRSQNQTMEFFAYLFNYAARNSPYTYMKEWISVKCFYTSRWWDPITWISHIQQDAYTQD
jgi:hypothetical protein